MRIRKVSLEELELKKSTVISTVNIFPRQMYP